MNREKTFIKGYRDMLPMDDYRPLEHQVQAAFDFIADQSIQPADAFVNLRSLTLASSHDNNTKKTLLLVPAAFMSADGDHDPRWIDFSHATLYSLGAITAAGYRLAMFSNSDGRIKQSINAMRTYVNEVMDAMEQQNRDVIDPRVARLDHKLVDNLDAFPHMILASIYFTAASFIVRREKPGITPIISLMFRQSLPDLYSGFQETLQNVEEVARAENDTSGIKRWKFLKSIPFYITLAGVLGRSSLLSLFGVNENSTPHSFFALYDQSIKTIHRIVDGRYLSSSSSAFLGIASQMLHIISDADEDMKKAVAGLDALKEWIKR